jgi:hypothetical protein
MAKGTPIEIFKAHLKHFSALIEKTRTLAMIKFCPT